MNTRDEIFRGTKEIDQKLDFDHDSLNHYLKDTVGSSIQIQDIKQFMLGNARHRAAIINVYDSENNFLESLKPAKSFYPTQPQPLTEVAIRRTFLEDLYLIFSSENANEKDSVTLKVYINPLVGWAWMALPIFTLGVGICMTYRPKSLKSQEIINRERYLALKEAG